jgi:hypothetical protein
MADPIEQDPGGSVLPEAETPLDAAAQLDAIEAALLAPDVFGDLGGLAEPTLEVTEPQPVGRAWAWDFDANRFVTGAGGTPLVIRGQAALQQRLTKLLLTARGAHPIYTEGFGVDEPFYPIGRSMVEALGSDFASRIEEALLYDPKVLAVENMEFEADADDDQAIVGSFTVRTDDDQVFGFRARLA